MASENSKVDTPPYTSYGTFSNFIVGLRDTGVPSRIDKSVLSKMSGSAQAALVAALKWLKLTDEVGIPTAQLDNLVGANEPEYSEQLAKLLRERYAFLSDGTINIEKATGNQVEQKFREYGIQGSTVIKCVAFFIAAAKDANITLGPHVKAPKATAASTSLKRQNKKQIAKPDLPVVPEDEHRSEKPGFLKIQIPLHGMADGMIYLPDNLTRTQWDYALKITQFLLQNYRADDPAEGL